MRARSLLLLAATAASVATSAVTEPLEPRIQSTVILHNGGDRTVTVEARIPVAPPACSLLRVHPELLGTLEWGEPMALRLAPQQNVSPPMASTDPCAVVHVTVPGALPQILMAHGEDFPMFDFPLEYASLSQVDPGVVVVIPGAVPELRPTSPGLLWPDVPPLPECGDAPSVAWATSSAGFTGVVGALEPKGDCTYLRVDGPDGGELDACGAAVPFEVGDPVAVTSDAGSLRIDLDDPDAPEPRMSFVLAGLWASLPADLAVRAERDADYTCLDLTEPACPRVRASTFEVLHQGESVRTGEVGETLEVLVDDSLAEVTVSDVRSALYASCFDDLDTALVVWAK
ncbi:MAG: hypothetical protein R3F61_05810 [Myxococcota bacterium]